MTDCLPSNITKHKFVSLVLYKRKGERFYFLQHYTPTNVYYKWVTGNSQGFVSGKWIEISEQEFNTLIYGNTTFKLI